VELDKEVLLWHLRRESGKEPALCLSREEKCDGCSEVDRYDAIQLATVAKKQVDLLACSNLLGSNQASKSTCFLATVAS
jgi:hypothetical protein